jgi:putative oxidoreductase
MTIPLAVASQSAVAGLTVRANALMSAIPYSLVALIGRISIAAVFWRSGQTKLDGWRVSDSAIELFREEYRLPLTDPVIAAYLATFAEHLFPILLVVGLATRLSALALLIMTLVIQIFVYPDAWPTHGSWAAIFLMLMAQGPGRFSLDEFIARRR